MKRAPYQRSQETQRKLIDAVIRLAGEKQYESITVQEICKLAGVSTGSFYHQFRSKDEVSLAAFQKVDWLLTGEVLETIRALPPLEAMDKLLRQYVVYVREQLGPVLGQYYRVLLNHPNQIYRDGSQRYGRELRHLLVQAIEQGQIVTTQAIDRLADTGIRLLRGLFLDWLIHGCSYDITEAYEAEFAAFLRLART